MTKQTFPAAKRKSFRLPVGAFVVVVALDQLTKTLVLRNIGLSERIDFVGPLSFVRRYNTGVAFSLGNGSAITAWLVTVVVAALLIWVVRTISRGTQPLFAVLLAVIAGGGVANQLDRLFRSGGWNKGAVIDFIDVGVFNFAIFNVADMALSVGCAVLAVWTLLGGGPDSPGASKSPASSGEELSSASRNTGTSVSAAVVAGLRSEPSVENADTGFSHSVVNGIEVDLSPSETNGAALLGPNSVLSNESFTKGR
jgi:signal peptidase II